MNALSFCLRKENDHGRPYRKPSTAFIGASWVALFAGGLTFMIGLWNASLPLLAKDYFFVLLMCGLFSAVSVQKSVRDRLEGIPVTNIYYGLSWFSILLCMLLMRHCHSTYFAIEASRL